ncbi:hypothetical protein CRENBAI_009072 [Crenichthys baileyi]|uniref:Uncharacterized protein n=1 Tax=Crenichthys baileyi TaxID=28760 RepID=A0AAV9S7E5_9TELE
MPHREKAQGTAPDMLEGLCLSAGLGMPWAPPGGTGEGRQQSERELNTVQLDWDIERCLIQRFLLSPKGGRKPLHSSRKKEEGLHSETEMVGGTMCHSGQLIG